MPRGGRTVAVADTSRRMPGRGAYLCLAGDQAGAAPACVAVAVKRNAISRALRAPAALDSQLVESDSR